MALSIAVSVQYKDKDGDPGRTAFFVKDTATDGQIIAVVDAMQGLSEGKIESWSKTITAAYAGTLTNPGGAYNDDHARAQFVCSTADPRQQMQFGIPCPLESLVTLPNLGISPSDAALNDLKAALTTAGASSANSAYTAVLKGKVKVSGN